MILDNGTFMWDFILHLCLSLWTNKHPVIFYCSPCWVGCSAVNQCYQLSLNNSNYMICHTVASSSTVKVWTESYKETWYVPIIFCHYVWHSQNSAVSVLRPFHSVLFGTNYSFIYWNHVTCPWISFRSGCLFYKLIYSCWVWVTFCHKKTKLLWQAFFSDVYTLHPIPKCHFILGISKGVGEKN